MRGRCYLIQGQAPVANPTKSLLGLTGGTTVRPNIYDLDIGSSATPADNALLWYIQRATAAGTLTAFTPVPLDSGDPASTSTAGYAHSVEPTYTAGKILFYAALNQRATHRFQFDPQAPLIIPATASNGVGLYAVHTSFTGNVDAMMYFEE